MEVEPVAHLPVRSRQAFAAPGVFGEWQASDSSVAALNIAYM